MAGSNSSIGSGAKGVTVALNTWYTVKFSVVGSTLTLFVDGTQVLSVTDTAITSGGIAVGTVNASAEFDDVKVTAP